jgi:hypothetical protein
MATLLPPPKRQKVYHGIPEPEPESPHQSQNIVVQFISEEDGRSLAPAVNIPANLPRESLEALLNKISIQVHLILPHIYIFNPSTCRMKTPFRSPSTLTCLKTRMLPKEHLHASSSLNPSKLTCSTTHQAPSRPKTSSSSTVHHKACFASDQPQDAPPPSLVRFLTRAFFSFLTHYSSSLL